MITLQDLIERFGEQELAELTDRDNYQTINQSVIDRAISDAEADVASYLQPTNLITLTTHGNIKYLAATTPPRSLIIKTCDIARYYLYENGMINIVEERYKQAIAWLKLVQKNPAMLTGGSDEVGADTPSGIHVIPNSKPNPWGE